MILEFSLACIFHHVWENLKFMVSKFVENTFNLGIFTYGPVPHSKHQAEIFENLFSLTTERGGESNYDLLYQNSIRIYEDDLEHGCLYKFL